MLAQNDTVVKTRVAYDRSARQWQAVNGTTQTFPAGADGKRQALLVALAHDHPTLSAAVKDVARINGHAPALVDRLLKAAALVAKGHVYADGKVKSQTDETVYTTDWDVCDCEDFQNGQARHAGLQGYGGCYVDGIAWPVCKHCLAQQLAYFVGWELEDEPIPF